MKHKHAEMIKAKADNMELVVLENDQHGKDEWYEIGVGKLPVNHRYSYFLCLPHHKEAVLNILNGGESQLTFDGATWDKCNLNQPVEWSEDWWYMKGESQSRIKPKKEKRWMIYSELPLSIEIFSDESVCDTVFSSKLPTENKQKIEIEVEA